MAWVATENFRSVDRTMESPSPVAALQFKSLGPTQTRMMLRYLVSEQNRYYFEYWDDVQIIYGLFFFFFLLFGTKEGKFPLGLALAMLLITMAQRFLLTPELISLGRNIDFIPPDMHSGQRTKFYVLHGGYAAAEVAKWGFGVVLGLALILAKRRSANSEVRQKLDLINKADYRHVDRGLRPAD